MATTTTTQIALASNAALPLLPPPLPFPLQMIILNTMRILSSRTMAGGYTTTRDAIVASILVLGANRGPAMSLKIDAENSIEVPYVY